MPEFQFDIHFGGGLAARDHQATRTRMGRLFATGPKHLFSQAGGATHIRTGYLSQLGPCSQLWYYIYNTYLKVQNAHKLFLAENLADGFNSTWDWFFTTRPQRFGLIPGMAFPTGFFLLFLLCVIVVCSLKWVRQGGYFEASMQ